MKSRFSSFLATITEFRKRWLWAVFHKCVISLVWHQIRQRCFFQLKLVLNDADLWPMFVFYILRLIYVCITYYYVYLRTRIYFCVCIYLLCVYFWYFHTLRIYLYVFMFVIYILDLFTYVFHIIMHAWALRCIFSRSSFHLALSFFPMALSLYKHKTCTKKNTKTYKDNSFKICTIVQFRLLAIDSL